MNKVYLLVENWACDFDGGQDIEVYNNYKKAHKEFLSKIENCKQEYDYDTEEQDDTCYSAWENGRYNENHTTIWLMEKEVL